MGIRGLPDDQDVAMYRLGFENALQMAHDAARRDHRNEMAKGCGYVPGWQRGRWMIADELAAHLKEIEAKKKPDA